MKVFELMAALMDVPAGANVWLQRGPMKFAVDLESVETDGLPDGVSLVGDGEGPSDGECQP